MDQRDHIATLCVAGTVGIAATGLALGVQTGHNSTYSTTPGKRKWPGASSLMSHPRTQSPLPQRRVVSQPGTSTATTTEEKPETFGSTLLFQRQSKGDMLPTRMSDRDVSESRGSSLNRSGLFRPRTSDTRSTSERRDPSTGSSWLKRISTVSSPRASSPGAASSNLDSTTQSTSYLTPDSSAVVPNKLVKRSMSHKALPDDQARGTFLRRPATSHQRSATVQEWTPREISMSTPATPYLSSESGPIWRSFFEPGYPRKRHTTANLRDHSGPRTISATSYGRPTLILGSQVDTHDVPDDQTEKINATNMGPNALLSGRQRLKRSLSTVNRPSRRRHVTDPTVKVTPEAVNGTITSAVKRSPLSPASFTSPFDAHLPHGSPSFTSSPPIIPARHRFSFRKRQSTAPSDPTTASSDNDTRVFTDDDSMDFQSDTAYDSLTTRATASSHSAYRTPKLDTIFNEPQATHTEDAALASLMRKATVRDNMTDQYPDQQTNSLRGIGITNFEGPLKGEELTEEFGTVVTPVKPDPSGNDEYKMTPVPHRLQYFGPPLKSSPPVLTQATANGDIENPAFVLRPRIMEEDMDDIDWSPRSDKQEKQSMSTLRTSNTTDTSGLPSSPGLPSTQHYADFVDDLDNESDKRLSSIFDWSEHQKVGVDGVSSTMIRPKTVHGKQGNDGSRSRSSGRKAPTQVHLRSQSVPNNRDPNAEQTPLSTSKFGTWGLGHKPISEEWSDDFEFDDVDENEPLPTPSNATRHDHRRISRGVKVPQAIIDRQASVHLQFGQVQEFMLLVEELKQLRARGAALHLLETQPSHHWDDAESIIELATINNEEDELPVRPSSPTSSDIFGDELLDVPRTGQERSSAEEQTKNLTTSRTTSSPATPSHGRPRGESLAQAKTFLQSIHQNRSGMESSPSDFSVQPQEKFPFDTQDLKDLVVRSGLITRALKEIIRKAEGLSASPSKTPPTTRDPAFSHIFTAPDASPCPPFRKPGIPKSKSANSYPFGTQRSHNSTIPTSSTPVALML